MTKPLTRVSFSFYGAGFFRKINARTNAQNSTDEFYIFLSSLVFIMMSQPEPPFFVKAISVIILCLSGVSAVTSALFIVWM